MSEQARSATTNVDGPEPDVAELDPPDQTKPASSDTGAPLAGGLALAAIVSAEFMLQLDGTIVNVALPELRADLGITEAGASWVLNAFLLAFGGFLLLGGRLGDALGHKTVFLAGASSIAAASLVAGLAPNFATLIIGRIGQGAGAALAGPAGLALLAALFQGARQQRAFGLYSTVTGLGAASGLILGALVTEAGGWRWSLLINTPLAVVIVLIGIKTIHPPSAAPTKRSLGVISSALVTAALTSGVYGLVRASHDGWSDAWTLFSLTAALVLLGVFVAVDGRTHDPLLPGRIFASRVRLGGFIDLLLLAAVLTSFLFFIPQYLASSLGLRPLATGFAILPFAVAIFVVAQFAPRYLAAVSLKLRGLIGLVIVTVAVALLIRLDGGSEYWSDVFPWLVVLGAGVGLAIVPFNMIILGSTAAEDTGITAGILQTALTFGGSLGIAILLIPYTSGDGPQISSVFQWSAGIAALAIIVTLGFWFTPERSKQDTVGTT
ncbi:MFS transporter [Rhodococcoides yunnanense]|uniref:MFS transporter n=1 Tax=Rhodococcoides yunnanense TaxID=278209 RepID=UPI001C3FB84B|nr:MFS transporter [Rhodococcus yunnanensis]